MSGRITATFPLPFAASGLMVFIAEKVRLNDAALICGTADEPDEPLELLDEPLLPQAAAVRAAQAATAVRAIFLLLRKSNETTSFVGLTCVHKWDVTALVRFGQAGRPLSGKP